MTSQEKRGGAFFCFQDASLWSILIKAVIDVEECSRGFLQ
jgi:hypothetical protein